MLTKVRNFSLSKEKQNGTFDERSDGLGWGPGYAAKNEGLGIDKLRYEKNYSQMVGTCKKCDKFTGKAGTAGEHCAIPANEHCQK